MRLLLALLPTLALVLPACGPTSPAVPESPYVHALGTQLYDGKNRPFVMRGVALGAWLFHETWISNFDYQVHGRLSSRPRRSARVRRRALS
ncbi:MAG: hypothetical protein EXR72_14200 [Myxococcales bacterium]|nr:hypothetical protein [Myxococcales bacterium]